MSQYESENLMYSLIKKILEDEEFSHLDVIFEYPLNRIVKDISLLNNEELRYISSLLAHIDFLIYNKITHKAVLAIEVDGYVYHKDGTRQHERDVMKDHILSLYKIDELRFSTIGSGEEEKIREKLKNM